MAEQHILISVIVPTYNRAHLIGETIQSVLDQTYGNWELIIIDDGSTDDTESVVRQFSDKRISYYPIEHCGIFGKVRNKGMQKATGGIVAFLDSDDLWKPDKLAFQLALLNEHPHADFIFGLGEQFGRGAIPPPEQERLFVGNVFLPLLLEERFVFYVPSVMFRKAVLDSVGYINENLIIGSDLDFFLRIACRYQGIYSNEILVRIRKHDQSTSQRLEIESYIEHSKMVDEFYSKGHLTRKQYVQLASKQSYKLGLVFLGRGESRDALKNFLKYTRLVPLHYKGWARVFQAALKTI